MFQSVKEAKIQFLFSCTAQAELYQMRQQIEINVPAGSTHR